MPDILINYAGIGLPLDLIATQFGDVVLWTLNW